MKTSQTQTFRKCTASIVVIVCALILWGQSVWDEQQKAPTRDTFPESSTSSAPDRMNSSPVSQHLPPIPNMLGRWVNITSPSEINSMIASCPSKYATGHGCCSWHHITEAVPKKFTWTNESTQQMIEPRKASNIMQMLHSKTLTFLGDSMSEQIFEGMLHSLARDGVPLVKLATVSPIPGEARWGREPHVKFEGYFCDTYNATIRNVKAYRFMYNETDRASRRVKFILSSEQLIWVMKHSDVLVVNFGMHYIRPREKLDFQPAMMAMTKSMAKTRQKHPNKVILLRDIIPNFSRQQKPDPARPNLCSPKKLRKYKWHNGFLKELAKNYSLPFFEVGPLYAERWDAKVGKKPYGPTDCVHFCHSPFIWEPLINGLYSYLIPQ